MKDSYIRCLIPVLLFCATAQADIISYIASTPLATTGSAKTIQLQGFNPGLGTLTQVELSYTGEVLQTGKAENTSTTLASMGYTLSGTANLTLSKSSGPAIFASPSGTFSFTTNGTVNHVYDGVLDFGGLSGVTYQLQDTVWNAPAPYLDSDLAAYLSTGLINFTSLATSTGHVNITSGNGAGGVITSAAATLQVEYTYTPVPEPATYSAILGLAVLGFVTIRRRTSLPT